MEIIDLRTGRAVGNVTDEEETLHALSELLDRDLRVAFDLLTNRRYSDAAGRTNSDVIAATTVLSRALNDYTALRDCTPKPTSNVPPTGICWGRSERPYRCAPSFDCYTAANATTWPVSPSTLRSTADLADANLDELAEHLNTALRRDAAHVLTECAHFATTGDDATTAWDNFATGGDISRVALGDIADAISTGTTPWTPLSDWTPTGGAFGDPYTVCRYTWGNLHCDVKLQPHELVAAHLAGAADLTLYRGILDYGAGPHEIIWPHQHFTCCANTIALCDQQRWPARPETWGQPDTTICTAANQCSTCGAINRGTWLTFRPTTDTDTPPGQIERLDAIAPVTLTATAGGLLTVEPGPPKL